MKNHTIQVTLYVVFFTVSIIIIFIFYIHIVHIHILHYIVMFHIFPTDVIAYAGVPLCGHCVTPC
jgi:hypothetical protein